ncbi:hypothetical protein WG906_03590 [Pedobacter sp. P351]|uniref:hypothetical protein n=1 Tax=Pedobacter superstes TaxID=3133441 RepID=UPI0030AC7C86
MYSKLFIPLFLASTFFLGCGSTDTEKKLDFREQEVQRKEQQLLILEQQLNLKEQELIRREQQADSFKVKTDTLGVYNPKLLGNWTVSMHCIEANCEGYAVGDIKTEHWNISYRNNKVIVKAMSNNKVIRTYSGLFKENSLNLKAQPVPDADTEMKVVLNPHATNENLMEGQRVIDRRNNCRVVFSLKVEKQQD